MIRICERTLRKLSICYCRYAFFTLFALLVLPYPSAYCAAETLTLANSSHYSIAGHLEILVDPDGKLSFKEILASPNAERFKATPGFINQSYTDATVWVRLSLLRKAPFPHDVYLRLWPPYLDFVDVYIQKQNNSAAPDSYEIIHQGDHIPVAQRPINHQEFITPFELPENTLRTIYIRVRTSSTLNLSGSIHTTADIIGNTSMEMILHSGYLAVIVVVAIINLIFFIRLRDRLYLFFSLYVLMLVINHISTTGLLSLLWPDQAHHLSDYFVGIGLGFSLITFSLFAMTLFRSTSTQWLHRYFYLMIFLGITTALSVPFGFYNRIAPVFFISSLIMIFYLSGLSFRRLSGNEPGGWLYLAAFGASNVGYSIQFLRLLGVLPVLWWNMYALQVGSIFNMLLMTFAFTERFRTAEEVALKTALESEQKAVQLAESMTENLRDKQAQLETALANKREALNHKDRFLAMINHEYRTPLAIVQANISLLEMKTADSDIKLMPVFNKIKRAMERLVEVLETSISRESQSDIGAWRHQQSIHLESFLKGILSEVRILWPDRRLHAGIPDLSGITLTGDMVLLKTAILNLLDNAFKYSPHGSKVTMEIQLRDQEVAIAVIDKGCGIPEEQIDLVFEKGYRASNMTDDSGKGLGLYLVKSIIEQYGGSLTVVSDLATGTTVSVTLPQSVERSTNG